MPGAVAPQTRYTSRTPAAALIRTEVTPSFGILLEVRLRGAVAETQLVEEESVPVGCLVDGLVE